MYFIYDVATRTGSTIIIIYMILLLIVLISNGLVMKVWLSAVNRSSSTITLSLIALYDMLTMVSGSLHKVTTFISIKFLSTTACYFDPIFFRFALFFHSMSCFTTSFLAIQRCTVCVFPFVGPRICGIRTIVIVSVASVVLLSLVPLQDFILNERHGNISATLENKTTVYCYVKPRGGLTKKTIDMIDSNIRLFVYQVIPAFITSFCMVVCLITVSSRRMQMGKSSHDQVQKRTTIMLVLIMLVFVLGEMPSAIRLFSKSFFHNDVLSSEIYFWFGNISLVVSYLVNIWIYIGMSKQFRESLRKLLCKYNEEQQNTSLDLSTK